MDDLQFDAWLKMQADNAQADNAFAEIEASGALLFLDEDQVQSPPEVNVNWGERDRQEREQTMTQLARAMAALTVLASQPADSPAARGPPVVPENTSDAGSTGEEAHEMRAATRLAAQAAEARAEASRMRGIQRQQAAQKDAPQQQGKKGQ